MQDSEDDRRWYFVAVAATLALAAAIRFRDLAASLFQDEVWVAELVLFRPWEPHAWLTPPLFYVIDKGWALLRGTSVVALREPAALFGVVLCAAPLFATHFDRLTRWFWLFLLAFSSPLLFYSTRLKQYTLEASVCAILIVCFTRALATSSRRAWLFFFLFALIGVTTLYSPIFVVFAAGMAALFLERESRWRILTWFALTAIAFAAAYFAYLAPGAESTRVHGDMDAFFTSTGRWMLSPRMVVATTLHWAGQAFNLTRAWWLVLLVAVFFWLTGRDDRRTKIALLLLCAIPPIIIAAASAFRYYPYGEVRLMAFTFPALFLVAAKGLSTLFGRARFFGIAIVTVFGAAFLWGGVVRETYNTTYMHLADLRPLYAFVERNHVSGEPVFADLEQMAAVKFHHPGLGPDVRPLPITGAGWYVGRPQALRTRPAVVMQSGNVIAARVAAP